jgi:nucleoid-associated protein YgaU
MGIVDFIRNVGEALGIGGSGPSAGDLKASLEKHGLPTDGLNIDVSGDTVKVAGKAASQELKEKIILALGNVTGIAKVDEAIETPAGTAAAMYTVQAGDTLSAIAKKHYGDANKYTVIFEANKPMLSHPDKIYPGQVLRIPALQA